jgi:CRISPR system Cascade subunit CasA
LWTEPWASSPLPPMDVHPLCLEDARMVRLVRSGPGLLTLKRAGNKAMRVDAANLQGNVRDPWTPLILDDAEPRSLTATRGVFGYQSLSKLLFDPGYCKLPLLARMAPTDQVGQSTTFVAQVLVSGNSKTDGLERRELPVPGKVLGLLAKGDARLGLRARQQVERASAAWHKALRSALVQYLDGGAEVNWKNTDFKRVTDAWSTRWDAAVDIVFFNHLFDDLDLPNDEADARWLARLAEQALTLFDAALASLPTRSASPRLAAARAERLLHNSWRKQFNAALRPTPETADAAQP